MNENLEFPFVSVIIPVYNNSDFLKKCLQALSAQSYPHQRYEVIIIDNASTENINDVVSAFPEVILGYEKKPGSYSARNAGIKIAKGTILAFTDSDCLPNFDWIEKGVEKLTHLHNCGLLAGKIDVFFRDPDFPSAVEFYDATTHFDQRKYVNVHKFGATANMFTFAQRFNEVGLFNGELKSSGDKEWGKRIHQMGFEIHFADNVVVKHPARSSIAQLQKKKSRVVGGWNTLEGIRLSKKQTQQNNSQLLREKVKKLKPPVSYLRWRISDDRLKGIHRKIAFVLIFMYLDYIVVWELIRLRLGESLERE